MRIRYNRQFKPADEIIAIKKGLELAKSYIDEKVKNQPEWRRASKEERSVAQVYDHISNAIEGCIREAIVHLLPPDVRDKPVYELGLSKRTQNILYDHNISHFYRIAKTCPAELASYKGMGEKALEEITQLLAKQGIYYDSDDE
jgi:DNA-directed RNA polymerase alpha subunit